jgi:hypothetical protein
MLLEARSFKPCRNLVGGKCSAEPLIIATDYRRGDWPGFKSGQARCLLKLKVSVGEERKKGRMSTAQVSGGNAPRSLETVKYCALNVNNCV